MHIFIANGTLQHREFHYRVAGKDTPRIENIPAGSQVQLPGDFEGAVLQGLITQLEQAGAIPQNELNAITRPHALLYRVAKRIESDAIDEAREKDTEARSEVAAQQMENAGIAAFNIAQKAGPVQETVVTITEVTDVKPVAGGVDHEVIVSQKPQRNAGRKRTTEKTARG